MAVVDCIGVMIAGADEEAAVAARRYAARSCLLPEATIVGEPHKVSAAAAALVNGTMAHACDYDDSSLSMWGHATAPVLSAALAMAEYMDASGSDLLTALAVGLEVQKVLGLATQPGHYKIGWHPTGTLGVFGAAAASAHLVGADAGRIARAISIAASRAAGVRANVGTMVKPLHVGFAARDGIDAAFLADESITGSLASLEGADGFLQCYAPDSRFTDDILSAFAAPHEVIDPGLAYKLYPCCADLHASVDAILKIRTEHGLDASDVKHIRCGVTPLAAGNAPYPDPKSPLQAKFSQEYCLAAAVVRGCLTLREFEIAAIGDPLIGRVRELVRVELSPDLSGADSVSFASPAEVEVETLDGRRFRQVVRDLRGHPSNPLSMADLEAKFASCADGHICDQAARQIIADIQRLDQVSRVRSFTSLLGACRDTRGAAVGGEMPSASRSG
jgi:2-methylcitrate dehydratase PrpD